MTIKAELDKYKMVLSKDKVLNLAFLLHDSTSFVGLKIDREQFVFAHNDVKPKIVKFFDEVYLFTDIQLALDIEVFVNFDVALVDDVCLLHLDVFCQLESESVEIHELFHPNDFDLLVLFGVLED